MNIKIRLLLISIAILLFLYPFLKGYFAYKNKRISVWIQPNKSIEKEGDGAKNTGALLMIFSTLFGFMIIIMILFL